MYHITKKQSHSDHKSVSPRTCQDKILPIFEKFIICNRVSFGIATSIIIRSYILNTVIAIHSATGEK